MKRLTSRVLFVLVSITFLLDGSNTWAQREPRLWKLTRELHSYKFVDLTHAFEPGIPHWKGFPDETCEDLFTYEKHGFWAQRFAHVGQWGTHVDPPAHFHKGLRTLDQIPPSEMILPLVVIDVTKEVRADPDFVLKASHVAAWEKTHGQIPAGAFVGLRTDWSKRWPDQARMQNADDKGVAHSPGWSVEALKYLIETRAVTAIGHETTDTDPGLSTSKDNYDCESYVLKQNRWQIELLTNLDQLPARGAMIVCTWPKPKDGSGFPARAFAVIP